MADKKTKAIRLLTFSAVMIFTAFLVSQMIGLGASGFDTPEILKQYTFYISGGIFLVGIICIAIVELLINKDDAKYGDTVCFVSVGEKPAIPIFKKMSLLQLFLISSIIFTSLGLFTFVFLKEQSFTGLFVLPQQFNAVTSTMYSTLLIPIAENLGAAFVLALLFFFMRFYARKTNMSNLNFTFFIYTLFPIIVGVYGLANHLLRYGDQQTKLFVVFLFWTIGGFLTIASGSFIPFWLLHLSNNLFIDLRRFMSIGATNIFIGIVIAVMIFIYIMIYGFSFKSRKNKIDSI